MSDRITRRQLFNRSAVVAAQVGVALVAVEGARRGLDLLELHRTWEAASRPNHIFMTEQAGGLSRLTLGGSFAPEQWPLNRGPREALDALDTAVDVLGLRDLRLGLRWSRSVDSAGRIDLRAYTPVLDACFARDVNVCLNVGPIRTFRWPEEHVPQAVLDKVELPEKEGAVEAGSPLAGAALDYLDALIEALRREYGDRLARVTAVQIENEPWYPLGTHRWSMSLPYLEAVADRARAAFPDADLLVTSAGRLNLHSVRDLFVSLLAREPALAGRLISGFDYHFKTPLRDSVPVIRHFDQVAYARPFAPGLDEHVRDSRALGFRIEVTEGQMEPYGHFTEPGNSARDFRFMLLRCLNEVLDKERPALIRIWGVEELAKKMLRGELTDQHRAIIDLIATVNGTSPNYPRV